jgi:hypothetical protein
MFYRTDLVSGRVGVRHDGAGPYLRGVAVTLIAGLAWTGLEHVGPADKRGRRGRRVERAIGDIHRAAYQHCKADKRGRLRAPQARDVERSPTGEKIFRGLPAVRRMTKLLLRRLKVTLAWELAQKQARKKREEQEAAAAAERETARKAELVRVLVPRPPAVEEHDPELGRETFAVRAEHEDWSLDDVRAEARRRLARRRQGTGPPE